jgi:adenylate cyclase
VIVHWWARRRLRSKIFLPFSVLMLTILLATLWVIGAAVDAWVERSLKGQFEVTGNAFRGLMAERDERLRAETMLLAGDFALKRAIATYDPDTLSSVALNYRERIGGDLLWITDESGKVLADSRERTPVGTALGGGSPLAVAIDTVAPAAAVAEVDGGLMQLVAVPVLAPDPIGFLVAGEAIDDATAAQLHDTTGTMVSFVTRARIFASSWPSAVRNDAVQPDAPVTRKQLAHAAGVGVERTTFLVRKGRTRLLSILIPIDAALPEPLYALVQDSYERALGPLADLPEWAAGLGLAALVGALLVGGILAAGIAAPLQALVVAMRRVLGGDFGHRLDVRREDEIGYLARSFNDMVAGLEERERIKETFGRFVSHDVAAAVLGGHMPLGGERREVTILFQDVRGFTNLAERIAPPVLVGVVNRLFTEMVAAVEAHGGVIGKFTGDGVMALFGAPVQHGDDPARAVRAALDMVSRLPALNAHLATERLGPIRIGIGIHTGDVVAGRFGPDRRSEYSVVGAAPILASRIEKLNKMMQTTILVSGVTAAHLGSEFHLGRRAVWPVRGKAKPIEVVEVLGCAPGNWQVG